ncbi:MAG: hypothetical protein ACLFUE_02740, partial [Desulfobacteraceae bacterium]
AVVDIADRPLPGRSAFTGIHILEPGIFELLRTGGHSDIVACYREMAVHGKSVGIWKTEGVYWRDIGTIQSYLLANKELSPSAFLAHPDSIVHRSVEVEDWAVVGAGCKVGVGARLGRSVLWENAEVGPGVSVMDSVVTSGRFAGSDLHDSVL